MDIMSLNIHLLAFKTIQKKSYKSIYCAETDKPPITLVLYNECNIISAIMGGFEMDLNGNTLRKAGRIIAGSYYDYQSVRKSGMNRVRDIIREKAEGLDKSKPEEKIEKDKRTFDKKYKDENLEKTLEEMAKTKKLTQEEYEYLEKFLDISEKAQKLENDYKNLMLAYVESEPIYNVFLHPIKGVGPVISARLIKSFGYCERYEHISSVWKHCGLHVVNGKAPKRAKGEKIEYSPELRSFIWNIGDSFIKQNSPVYREFYDQAKKQYQEVIFKPGELLEKYGKPYKDKDVHFKPLHAHNRAKRKMEKLFLSHYWMAARETAGLSVSEPYVQEKLGHEHIITWQSVVNANLEAKPVKRKVKKAKKE
jgi:hypothetical protein